MSEENVEIVRRAIGHLNRTGEPDWRLYDPKLIWRTRRDGPAHSTYRGLDGLRRAAASFREVWAEVNGEIVEVVEQRDVVVAVIHWRLRGHSGVELEVEEGWATWLRDGKITRIEQHGNRREAIEAAGLSG